MLKSVNGWGFTWKIWSRVPAPGLTVLIDHIGPGAGLRPDGTVQPWVHLSRLPCTLRLGFARLAPLIFFVSMTKIKVQEEYINDNLELCPNIEATIWATSSIILSLKAWKEKGKLRLSIAFLTQPFPIPLLTVFPEPIIVVLINWFRDLRFPDLITGFWKY